MSLCEQCSNRVATVHVSHIASSGTTISHLCEECARENGIPVDTKPAPQAIAENQSVAETQMQNDSECSHCHLKFSNFKKSGLLGCVHCYTEFEQDISAMVSQIHDNASYAGKRYAAHCAGVSEADDIVRLKKELAAAVTREEFELAAILRDSIRRIASVAQ